MAVTKPAKIVRWADSGGVIVEPAEGKKDIGWLVKEKPPAQYDNWFKNMAGQWVQYLEAIAGLGVFGSGSNGAVTVAGTTTVAAPVNYTDLTISAGGIYLPQAYIIRCNGTFDLQAGATMRLNGSNGGNGNGAAGGTPGLGVVGDFIGSVPGGAGSFGAAVKAGNAGYSIQTLTEIFGGAGLGPSINTNGLVGLGGYVTSIALAGFGSGTGQATNYKTLLAAINALVPAPAQVFRNASSPVAAFPGGILQLVGGAGGGGGEGSAANGGGAGGDSGGLIVIVARSIKLHGTIEVKGGNGGNGHTAGNSGGGAGGSGGQVLAIYLEDYDATGLTLTATKGSAGAGHGTGTAPTASVDGPASPFTYKLVA